MIQRRQHLSLAFETSHALGVIGERGGQNFQRDLASEIGVGRAINLTHPARAQGRDDLIRPYSVSRG